MYSQLRNHVETAYWEEAVTKLTSADKQELSEVITGAQKKLSGTPVQVPHEEHRRLHILIYSRLNNPFVTGLLEAYWDAYEAVGLNLYSGDIDYLLEVWKYHAAMVQSIWEGNYPAGREALIRHVDLLTHRRG
jgi:DNA-binding GntR family transcriptional regulator